MFQTLIRYLSQSNIAVITMRLVLVGISFILLLYSCNVDNANVKETPVSNEKFLTVLDFHPTAREHSQRSKLASKYGFELVSVISDGFKSKEMDSAEKANELTFKKLDKRNGPDWKNRYEKEVSAMYTRDTTIISFLKKEPYILAKEVELSRYGNNLEFFIDTTFSGREYRVNVYGPTGTTNKTVSFYRIYMDTKNLKITRKDEGITPFGKN